MRPSSTGFRAWIELNIYLSAKCRSFIFVKFVCAHYSWPRKNMSGKRENLHYSDRPSLNLFMILLRTLKRLWVPGVFSLASFVISINYLTTSFWVSNLKTKLVEIICTNHAVVVLWNVSPTVISPFDSWYDRTFRYKYYFISDIMIRSLRNEEI